MTKTARGVAQTPELSVVIPAYNEEKALPGHFAALAPLLDRLFGDSWEVIVFDDGSEDKTFEVTAAYGHPRIKALRHAPNRGKGAAVRSGFLATKGKRVLLCDADMSTPPETLPEFLAALSSGADIAIGNRVDKRARITRRQSLARRFFGTGFIYLSRFVTRTAIEDFNCGYKLFRGDLARELLGAAKTARWAYDIEVLALAVRRGCKIAEIPVEWRHMDNSNVRLATDIFRTLGELAKIWLRLKRQPTGKK